MAEAVSAFGYSVPLATVLLVLALVVGLALAVLFWLTVGWSVYRSVQDTRRRRVRDDVQDGLLDGVFDPEFDWYRWVDDLSAVEREVAESLLDEYLRELDGENRERLQELGAALGIVERSERRLRGDDEYERLYALTWLTLLGRPEPIRRVGFTPRTLRERTAVARLRYESGDFDDPAEGIELLVADAATQFTIFGQDTLFRIAAEDPGRLFEMAEENYRDWPEQLLVQVLTLCRHLGTSITTEDVSWVVAALDHESERVRETAPRALEAVGWRDDVRDERFAGRLVDDPSPRVRASVYRMLARWGDDEATGLLLDALEAEPDPRARLAGTDALVGRRSQSEVPPSLAAAWAWSTEHDEYDRTARRRGRRLPT